MKLLVIERKVLDNAELISVLWTDLLITKGELQSLLPYLILKCIFQSTTL